MKGVTVIGKLDFNTGIITYKGLFKYPLYRKYHKLKSTLTFKIKQSLNR